MVWFGTVCQSESLVETSPQQGVGVIGGSPVHPILVQFRHFKAANVFGQ